MTPTPAGKFNRRVTIKLPTEHERTESGGVIPGEETETIRWASIEPLSGLELIRAQKLSATANHLVKIRYMRGLTVKHFLMYGIRKFSINSIIDPEDKHVELHLYCKEDLG